MARVIAATTPSYLRIEGPILVCGPPEDITLGPALRAPEGLMKLQAFALASPDDGEIEPGGIEEELQSEDDDREWVVGFSLLFVACAVAAPPQPLARIPEIRLLPI